MIHHCDLKREETYYEQTMSLGLIPRAFNKSSSHIILVSVWMLTIDWFTWLSSLCGCNVQLLTCMCVRMCLCPWCMMYVYISQRKKMNGSMFPRHNQSNHQRLLQQQIFQPNPLWIPLLHLLLVVLLQSNLSYQTSLVEERNWTTWRMRRRVIHTKVYKTKTHTHIHTANQTQRMSHLSLNLNLLLCNSNQCIKSNTITATSTTHWAIFHR